MNENRRNYEDISNDTRGERGTRKRLSHLREVERFKIVKDIEEARAHGDISNSEYEDAEERRLM